MTFIKLFFLIVLVSFAGIQKIQAEETDQFTLPPTDLLDLGPTASQRLAYIIETVLAQTNSEIQSLLPKVKSSRVAASQLALRLKDTYIADLIYDKTGPGFPRWLRLDRFDKQVKPIQFKEKRPWQTVYWLVFSPFPPALIGLAPTINMYEHYLGTDKLGHFFMQGHSYYKLYMYFLNGGKSAEQAHRAMIRYGQVIEQSYMGTVINGIYSNADLSANYAGWKFYMNLFHHIRIGHRSLPPLLVLKGNRWEFTKHVNKDELLKPYITDNLNEALNPSRYAYSRGQIRNQVKKRCANWIERRGITKEIIIAKLQETKRWHGEAYGHWLPEGNAITLETCFKDAIITI
ncbi:MAG: hypothetical protein H0T84_07725 [Tatlockia sp.]|nr:hypothetical protein [Tatlockia sp.]